VPDWGRGHGHRFPASWYVSTSRSLLLLNRSINRCLLTRDALLIGVGEIDSKKNSNFLVVNSSASPKLKLNSN
jgi:hypothetical protein